MKLSALAIAVAILTLTSSCLHLGSHAVESKTVVDPKKYLDHALDLLQTHSLWKDRVDWEKTRKTAHDMAAHAKMPSDAYAAIRFAIEQLDEPHTRLLPPTQKDDGGAGRRQLPVRTFMLPDELGYIEIPPFWGYDEAAKQFANAAHESIRRVDEKARRGWIVDLSQNTGGTMMPMLAALGPIIGEVGPQKDQTKEFKNVGGFQGGSLWGYGNGEAYERVSESSPDVDTLREWPGFPFIQTVKVDKPYVAKDLHAPIAVLLGSQTASSGEIMAIILKGVGKQRPVRFFGASTSGLTSANSVHQLEDGARLLITEASVVDGDGRSYHNTPLEPDVATGDARTVAKAWLETTVQKF